MTRWSLPILSCMKMKDKQSLRNHYKQRRKQLGDSERLRLSEEITRQALQLLSEHAEWKHIHVFLPIRRLYEIDTLALIEELIGLQKKVYTSIADFADGGMSTVKIGDQTTFHEDSWGIPIPVQVEELSDPKLLQVVFIPLLAYDRSGNRLGYGKGFYDRFLADLSPSTVKIGLSYFLPEEQLEVEDHDVPLDYCLTPAGILTFS